MEIQIKEFLIFEFDYEAFIEMLKKHLFLRKVRQIKVRMKLKFLCQKNSQILSEFISHLKTLERDIKPPLIDLQRHQNLLYSMHYYL